MDVNQPLLGTDRPLTDLGVFVNRQIFDVTERSSFTARLSVLSDVSRLPRSAEELRKLAHDPGVCELELLATVDLGEEICRVFGAFNAAKLHQFAIFQEM